ncbi:MAG: helix-turn-helix domain-containing protein [Anaerolineaceae bacterium]|nr:helix-turn-helix domain-containing protein [Anaerolineaceae bacterium]
MAPVSDDKSGICDRIRSAREAVFGLRGRAAFARALGLSPSTYIYYEKGRVPPAEVLARAAEVAGVRLQWLITGQGERETPVSEVRRQAGADLPPELQAAVDRLIERPAPAARSALRRHSHGASATAAARAFAEMLATVSQRFPAGRSAAWQEQRLSSTDGMIPILGRTAAGLVGSYQELLGEEPAVTVADIAQRALGLDVHRRAVADLETDDTTLQRTLPEAGGEVSLVQLNEPLPSGVVEFLDAPALRQKHPSAFAVRVDGESMTPRFRHGDVVIAEPGGGIRPGQAALVQIRGRVGITLKLVRREEGPPPLVHLVPINERYDTERLGQDDIEWMAPVLFSVRL